MKNVVAFAFASVALLNRCGDFKEQGNSVKGVAVRDELSGATSSDKKDALVYYLEDNYVRRARCKEDMVANPGKYCAPYSTDKLPYTTGIAKRKFEKILEEIKPKKSQLTENYLKDLKASSDELEKLLADKDLNADLKQLYEGQLKKNREQEKAVSQYKSDYDFWITTLESKVIFDVTRNAGANDVVSARLEPFIDATNAAFVKAESDEKRLQKWSCSGQCVTAFKETYTHSHLGYHPFNGTRVWSYQAGEVRSSSSSSYPYSVAGYATENEARSALATRCSENNRSRSTRNTSLVTVGTMEGVSCSYSASKPEYAPIKFPY